MSYAFRNTIILLVTLLVIAGGGFFYLNFITKPKIEKLEENYQARQKDYKAKEAISSQFKVVNNAYVKALELISMYDKSLFEKNAPDDVFEHLSNIVDGYQDISYDYVFEDSLVEKEYGIIRSSISGVGDYTTFVTMINRLEHSQLLNKVSNLSLSSASSVNDKYVNFSFKLDSYFQKIPILETKYSEYDINTDPEISSFNSFFPLIQSTVPPNDSDLINIEASRIVGLTPSRVFVINQDGLVSSLKVGDKVYLGYLESIDPQNKSVLFNLNKGGITELVTLEVEH